MLIIRYFFEESRSKVFPSTLLSPYFVSVIFLFGLQLALLTADDFARWYGFDVHISVALQSIFLVVSFVILFKES